MSFHPLPVRTFVMRANHSLLHRRTGELETSERVIASSSEVSALHQLGRRTPALAQNHDLRKHGCYLQPHSSNWVRLTSSSQRRKAQGQGCFSRAKVGGTQDLLGIEGIRGEV